MKTPNVRSVSIKELGNLIAQKRSREGLTLEQAAVQSGLSMATLSRWERQHYSQDSGPVPDNRTVLALAKWLGISIDQSVSVQLEDRPLPDVVEAHLRANPELDERTAMLLGKMFRVAYESAIAEGSNKSE